jgi:hypothetical protein
MVEVNIVLIHGVKKSTEVDPVRLVLGFEEWTTWVEFTEDN